VQVDVWTKPDGTKKRIYNSHVQDDTEGSSVSVPEHRVPSPLFLFHTVVTAPKRQRTRFTGAGQMLRNHGRFFLRRGFFGFVGNIARRSRLSHRAARSAYLNDNVLHR
jgi:hypothetical protein